MKTIKMPRTKYILTGYLDLYETWLDEESARKYAANFHRDELDPKGKPTGRKIHHPLNVQAVRLG